MLRILNIQTLNSFQCMYTNISIIFSKLKFLLFTKIYLNKRLIRYTLNLFELY